jgi:ELWxxDGT repeat protein
MTPSQEYRLPRRRSFAEEERDQAMPLTFFVRTTDANGAVLWATDGTPGGAHLVKDINPGTASSGPFNRF